MHTLQLTSRTDSEGFLHLKVPVALPNTEINVTMTFQPVSTAFDKQKSEELGWSPSFFEETFGAWEGELERESQVTLPNPEFNVTMTLQPIFPILAKPHSTPVELGYSPGFFERTAGAWEGEPLVRGG
jgi:hypothetical protein